MSTGQRVALMGDLNSKWDAKNVRHNKSDKTLRDFAKINDLNIHYHDTHTHFPFNDNHTPSTLDIMVTKNITDVRNMRTIPSLNSDHDPVVLEIRTTNKPLNQPGKYFDYKKTNWNNYRRTLDTIIQIRAISMREETDTEVEKLIAAIKAARDRTTPLMTRKQHKEVISQDIHDLIRNKNSIRKI